MAEMGANTLRVFTVPPVWLLDIAARTASRCWSASPGRSTSPPRQPGRAERDPPHRARRRPELCRTSAVFAYLIGNEIPPTCALARAKRVRAFLRGWSPQSNRRRCALVSYANFPSTEYLTIDFTDFLCFNVYLHQEEAFRRYVSRLHNLPSTGRSF